MHTTVPEIDFPEWCVPQNQFPAQGFGAIPIPFFYAEMRKQMGERMPKEQQAIINPAYATAIYLATMPTATVSVFRWAVRAGSMFGSYFRGSPVLTAVSNI